MSAAGSKPAVIDDPPVRNDSPFGKPLDPAILAEPQSAPPRPFPWPVFVALLVPAIGFAGAALWQRYLDDPLLRGDLAGRWLWLASAIGLFAGVIAGSLLPAKSRLASRLGWAAWGLLAPLVITSAIHLSISAAHPIREMLAERAAAKCRLTRQVCSLNQFRELCTSAPGPRANERLAEKLGQPEQKICGAEGCTLRWSYAGPWTPDNWVAPGSVLCSVVTDPAGNGQRFALGPGNEVP